VQKIRIEWTNDGVTNKRVIKKHVYRDCAEFYSRNPSVDKNKVKCVDLKIYKGKNCEVVNGSLENLSDCSTTTCPKCTSCEELGEIIKESGGVMVDCWKTDEGYFAEFEKLTLIKKKGKNLDKHKLKLIKN